MSFSSLPVVGKSKKCVILYALREQAKTKYVYSNADATVIKVISAQGVLDNKSDFVNVSGFLSGSSGEIISKKGLSFPYYSDIMDCEKGEKAAGEESTIPKVIVEVPEEPRLDGSLDYTTDSAYISAYIKRKQQIDVLNKTYGNDIVADEQELVSTLPGFDIAKRRHDMYIKQLNK